MNNHSLRYRVAILVPVCLVLGICVGLASQPSHTGYPRLMQGPMVGVVTPDSAKIWIRTSGEFPVSIQYATNRDFNSFPLTLIFRLVPSSLLKTTTQ